MTAGQQTILREFAQFVVSRIKSGLKGVSILASPSVDIGSMLEELLQNLIVPSKKSNVEGLSVCSTLDFGVGGALEQ
ncbi:uncharacterized protein N7446_010494 [Penicillium canescens]|uniref:Uncharacterized protein n=1 Tax=Penicillium canescens TaxID=5083 RepID=A0AAD6N8L4_PENCN|nr:uncharacterized protein N7446_010494 [Penicillium canescens]KAJ6041626.1 hypothetical protein N7460_007016 [Penicillium canescens]KAJ6050385.1 hypothetical protein N7446_010494 [Penicillium canescens]KAJ6064687.1 hypothetical protein N7444_000340 [Penicillium canescens]